jgi:hypothetical protein
MSVDVAPSVEIEIDDVLPAVPDAERGLPRTLSDPHTFVRAVHKGLWAHHNKLNPNVV